MLLPTESSSVEGCACVHTCVHVHVCVWGLYSPVAPGSGGSLSAVLCPVWGFPVKETHGHMGASPADVSMWSGALGWDIQGGAQGTVFAQPGEDKVKRILLLPSRL